MNTETVITPVKRAILSVSLEAEEGEYPSYAMVDITQEWLKQTLTRMDNFKAHFEQDNDLLAELYLDYNVVFFDSDTNFELPYYSNPEKFTLAPADFDIDEQDIAAMDFSKITIDADSAYFKAFQKHEDVYCVTGEISRELLELWLGEIEGK